MKQWYNYSKQLEKNVWLHTDYINDYKVTTCLKNAYN